MTALAVRPLAAAALVAGCVGAAACRTDGAWSTVAVSSGPPIERRVPPVLPPSVRVRLSALGGRSELTFRGTPIGPVRLRARGDEVVTDSGRALESVLLTAAEGLRGVGALGNVYPGRLEVRARADRLTVENTVELEEYVVGVVAAELSIWSAEPAELEAQAIVARSYATAVTLPADGRGRALADDERDQMWRGAVRAREGAEGDVPPAIAARLQAAVRATRGLVLTCNGRVVRAFYHAACGGSTTDGARVFGSDASACSTAAACEPCAERYGPAVVEAAARDGAGRSWSWTAPRTALDALARAHGVGPELTALGPCLRDPSGRWLEVELTGTGGRARVPFEAARRALGTGSLASGRIVRTWPPPGRRIEGGLYFQGVGRGHGVGLCQEGARGYAARGWSAESILARYHSGARIERGEPAGAP